LFKIENIGTGQEVDILVLNKETKGAEIPPKQKENKMIKDKKIRLELTIEELNILQTIVGESRKTGCKGISIKDRDSLYIKIGKKLLKVCS